MKLFSITIVSENNGDLFKKEERVSLTLKVKDNYN
jgi:hypothetical protein